MASNSANQKPNIVIMYADDLGYGDLSCYGAEDIKTPNVDKLCEDGLLFSDAYSTSPVCSPARFSMLTGKYPCRQDGVNILPGDAKSLIDEDCYTMPRMLQENGYHTGIVGKWHLGLSDGTQPIDWNKPVEHTPLDLGFDECFIFPATADRVPCVYFDGREVVGLDKNDPIEVRYCYKNPYKDVPTGRHNKNMLKMKASHGHDCTIINGVGRIGYMRGGEQALWKDEDLAETFLNRAKKFVDDHADEPFFLYYALHQPHVPRLPSKRFVGSTNLGARGDVIKEMDWCVGELVAKLDEHNLLDNTIIIFSSDNGPVLDDGYKDYAKELNGAHRPTGPLRGGKYSKFEGGIRVPFIVSYRGHIRTGLTNAVVSQVDLMASFAHMLGVDIPNNDSENMLDALLGIDPKGRDVLYAESNNGSRVIRKDKWLYIEPDNKPRYNFKTSIETAGSRRPQLYNLQYDIGEKKNLARQYPDIVKELETIMNDIASRDYNVQSKRK